MERHGEQKYGNDLPYVWHLGHVAAVAEMLGYSEFVQAGGWLHDTVEDTDTTIQEIEELFGEKMATMVEGVTYLPEHEARGIDKVQKALGNPGSHVLKFCDASVNMAACVVYGMPPGKDPQKFFLDRYVRFVSELRAAGLPTPEQVEQWRNSSL